MATELDARIAELSEWGQLSDADRAFGRFLSRLAPEERDWLDALGTLVMQAYRAGHVCLDWKASNRWLERAIACDSVVGSGDSVTPLVFDGTRRWYLHRNFERETRLAEGLRARAAPRTGRDLAAEQLDALFGPDPSDRRRAALIAAERSGLLVLTGGPGTGKTTAVVRLLAGMAELYGEQRPSVLLLAPTGKAAARLTEAVERAARSLTWRGGAREAIVRPAMTVHRALLSVEEGSHWGADIVVVDECSMVDLELMARIESSTRKDARLILLGDPDQLASVEAGSVLADITEGASETGSPLASSSVALTKSHRYASESALGRLAEATRRGDSAEALRLLDSGAEGIVRVGRSDRAVLERIHQSYERLHRALGYAEREKRFGEFRVLCAHRREVSRINSAVRRRLGAPAVGPYEALPLLVRANDPELGVFNGDIGFVDGKSVHFGDAMGERSIPYSLLGRADDAYAMSIHQSQGSEVDEVVVFLPDADSPLASRELLFTALTRARHSVTLVGERRDLEVALGRRVQRASGLAQRLARAS